MITEPPAAAEIERLRDIIRGAQQVRLRSA